MAGTLAALVASCADDDGSPPDRDAAVDAGVDGEAGDAAPPDEPELPAPPAPPVLTPCPPGWSETPPDLGVVTCEPWPARTDLHCPAGEAWFPGEAGCAPLGPDCPDDGWPADLPAEDVLYVSAGAKGGLGTRALPFGTIGEALDVAGTGDTLALGVGTYDEVVIVRRGLSFRGACVTGTVWTSSIVSDSAALTVAAGASDLRDVGFADLGGPAIAVTGVGAALSLTDVAVDGATLIGVNVINGGHLDATRLAVRGTVPRASDRRFGFALDVEFTGSASLHEVVLLDNASGLIADGEGCEVTADDLAIAGSRSDEVSMGRGFYVQNGARATIRRAILEDNQGVGFHTGGGGASATLEDVVVRDTRATIEDAVPDVEEGRGLTTILGASLHLSRCTIEHNRDVGVYVLDPGSQAWLDDVVVRDTESEAVRDTDGPGMDVEIGGQATLRKVLLARNRMVGFLSNGSGPLLLDDVLIADTRGRALEGAWGVGMWISNASVEGHRVRAERNRTAGIRIDNAPSSLVLEDVAVLDTASRVDERGGNGVYAQGGVTADLTRVLLQGNREVALYTTDAAQVTARDATIADTLPRACATSTCPGDDAAGHGVGAYSGAEVTLERFVLGRQDFCGAMLDTGGGIDLHDGTIEDNGLGVCVQVPGYDVARLSDRVRYGPGQYIEMTDLPIPEPAPPF